MPARLTGSLCSAVLSCATSFGALAGILRFDFLPERFMRYTASCSESFPSRFQYRLEFGRVSHEQPLKIFLALGAEQYCDRFAFAGHNDRPLLGGFHVLSKIGSDFILSCNFHNSTSFPATISRLPSFKPMAWI